MKITATATSNIRFESNGQIVNIVKGDTFNLVGTVFAYHGILIDITQYAGMFNIVRHSDAVKHLHAMKVVRPFSVIDNNGKEVRLEEGTVMHAVSDIVAVGDCVIDIVKWRDNLVQIDESECTEHAPVETPVDAPEEPAPVSIKKLDAPVNAKLDNDVLTWDAVENADAYDIYINGQNAGEVIEPSANLAGLLTVPGQYCVGVVAKHANPDGKMVYSKATDTNTTVADKAVEA
jgi:hypothetical protein